MELIMEKILTKNRTMKKTLLLDAAEVILLLGIGIALASFLPA